MQNGVTNTRKHPSALGGQDCPWGTVQHCDTLACNQTLPVVDLGATWGEEPEIRGDERMKDSLGGRKGDGENPRQDKGTESKVGRGRVPGQRDQAEGLKGQQHGRREQKLGWGRVRSHRGLRRRKAARLDDMQKISQLNDVSVIRHGQDGWRQKQEASAVISEHRQNMDSVQT